MKILIVEDEKPAARGLERMLRELLGNKITSLRVQNNLIASECYLMDNPIDLLFLDLNLNGDDGFELLQNIVSASFQTIIVSANHEQALRAFEYGVLDFVPKPISRDRLQRALERMDSSSAEAGSATRYISVRRDERLFLIDINDVIFFQGADNYVNIQLRDGRTERCRKTLESLQKIVPPRFKRIHKSYLVSIDEIKEVRTSGASSYEAVVAETILLPMSRTFYRELKSTSK